MDALKQVVNDGTMMSYGGERDNHYTCFEDYGSNIFHCVKAQFDDCWSSSALLQVAKVRTVSPYIPSPLHDTALKWKYPNTIVYTMRELQGLNRDP